MSTVLSLVNLVDEPLLNSAKIQESEIVLLCYQREFALNIVKSVHGSREISQIVLGCLGDQYHIKTVHHHPNKV